MPDGLTNIFCCKARLVNEFTEISVSEPALKNNHFIIDVRNVCGMGRVLHTYDICTSTSYLGYLYVCTSQNELNVQVLIHG